ncbi:MAG: DUF2225 domain-containing protein [Defluviitaleaceae bacterium]|nr:DUF2225 domain-containing protein [Defluviitaleaceae bacterium]
MSSNVKLDIFGGLEKFGFQEIIEKDINIFESPKPKKTTEVTAPKVFDINNIVYAKKFNCPVCLGIFESYVVKTGKTRLEGIEYDLRSVYTPIEPLFYDILSCSLCGYTGDTKTFDRISNKQVELLLTELKPHYKHQEYPIEPSVEQAIDRYKLALLTATIKKGKQGEKAYFCMKLTWLYRIKGDDPLNEKKFAILTIKGLTRALEEERTPIMGMEEVTILYIIAAFSKFLGNNKNALKILSSIITSRKSSERLRDRARDLKDDIMAAAAENELAKEEH